MNFDSLLETRMKMLFLILVLLVSTPAWAQTTNPCTEPIGFQMLPDGEGQVFVPLTEHTMLEPDGKTPRVGEYSYALFNEGTNPDNGTPIQGPTTVPKSAFALVAGTPDCYQADLPQTIPMDVRLVAALKARGPNGESGWSPISNPFSSVPNVPKPPGKPAIRP
jgi:hypothetical protein